MRSVSVRLVDLNSVRVKLGFVGENEHTTVLIDCKKAFDQYPNAVPSLFVTPPRGESYPAVVERDGNIISWTVTDSDLIYDGFGEFQLSFTQDSETVMKSDKCKTHILPSIIGSGNVPTPVENWLETASETLQELPDTAKQYALAALDEMTVDAEELPAGSEPEVEKTVDPDTCEINLNFKIPAGGGGTSDYEDLENKPSIGGVTLNGDTSLHDIGAAAESDIPDVSGFYTKPAGGIPASDIADGVIPDVSGKANLTVVAPAFNQANANDAGSFVTYTDGVVYLLPDGHTAGATWANTTKTATNIGTELTSVKTAITKVRKVYDTVEDMLDDESLTAGLNVETRGYYAAGDNGHNEYKISATHEGVFYLTLDNGLYANLVTEKGVLRSESIGIKSYPSETNDPDEDDMDNNVLLLNRAIYNGVYLLLGKGWMYFSDKVNLAQKSCYTIRGVSRETTHLVFPNSDGLYFSDARYYNYYVIKGIYIHSYGHCIRCAEDCLTVLDSHFEWLYLISDTGDGFHGPEYNVAKYIADGGQRIVYDTCVQNAVFDFINVQAENGAGIANVMGMYSTYKHFNFVSCKYAFRNCDGKLEQANTLAIRPGLYMDYFIYYDKAYSHSLKWSFVDVNAEGIGKAFIFTENEVLVPSGEDPRKPETANIMTITKFTARNSGWSLSPAVVSGHDVYPITVQRIRQIDLENSDTIIKPAEYPNRYDQTEVKGELRVLNEAAPIRYDGGPDIICVGLAYGFKYRISGELNRGALALAEGHDEDGLDVPYKYSMMQINRIYGGKATQVWNVKASDYIAEYNSLYTLNPPKETYQFADIVKINNDTANALSVAFLFNQMGLSTPGRIITVVNASNSLNNIMLIGPKTAGANTGGFAIGETIHVKPNECIHLISTIYKWANTPYVEWKPVVFEKTELRVTGTDPEIVGKSDTTYICGEVNTIDITPPSVGTIEVQFLSGSTPAVLTLPRAVKLPAGFDPSDLEADTLYIIRITDGSYGEVENFVEQPFVNLLDPSTFVDDRVWYNGTTVYGYTDYCATPKIEVTPEVKYILKRDGGVQGTACWFDENEDYVSQEVWDNGVIKTIGNGIHYVAFNIKKTEKNTALFAVY